MTVSAAETNTGAKYLIHLKQQLCEGEESGLFCKKRTLLQSRYFFQFYKGFSPNLIKVLSSSINPQTAH